MAFKDHYQEGLLEIIEAKMKGKKIKATDNAEPEENVDDIVSALKKSLEQSKKKTHKKNKSKKSHKKKTG